MWQATPRTWKHRRFLQAVWDAFAWLVSVPLSLALRYDFSPPQWTLGWALTGGLFAAILVVVLGYILHFYRDRYVVGSFDEVFGIVAANLIVSICCSLVMLVLPATQFPRSTFIIATGVASALMLGARFIWRSPWLRSALRRSGSRTLIYGAGDAGSQIASLMLTDATGAFQPIGFIDDDPRKVNLRRSGLRVLGSLADLERLSQRYQADNLLVAIAGVSASALLSLDRRCLQLGMKMRLIPTVSEIAGGGLHLGGISQVSEEDLMGRRVIQTDEKEIAQLFSGKRILVTGADGSLGSELARQLARYGPSRHLLLDRDQSALDSVHLSLDGTDTLTSEDLILADTRDASRVKEIFVDLQPQVVFHAAALKHLPLLERSPEEALKTNVLGTLNALEACKSSCVEEVVNVSTDKAADPTSVLGYSKLITERLVASVPVSDGSLYVSVRFGNVLGWRGSVIDTFRHQIKIGGPSTVTHENVTRYFMTVREAVHLVLQASALGSHGETLILDMGSPVRILDTAQYRIEKSGRELPIRITGLRLGEKLEGQLISTRKSAVEKVQPLVSHTRVVPLGAARIPFSASWDQARELLETLARFPPQHVNS